MKLNLKQLLTRALAGFLAVIILLSPLSQVLPNGLTSVKAESLDPELGCMVSAQDDFSDLALAQSKVGGISLDQAATYLSELSTITGAYYDNATNRIVFVGQKSTTAPKFNKEDLAIAIKQIAYNNTVPQIDLDLKSRTNVDTDPYLKVSLTPGLEDTKFGNTMIAADYAMKKYALGYDEYQNKVSSRISGYQSITDRYLAKTTAPSQTAAIGRIWLSPDTITIKNDATSSAIVFDSVKMKVKSEMISGTMDPTLATASAEFAKHMSDNYDAYANESTELNSVRELAKIVSIVKWIKDSGIPSDFDWARNFTPSKVATPREVKRINSQYISGTNGRFALTGGLSYDGANLYTDASGRATQIQNDAANMSKAVDDSHWNFSSGGTYYSAVAVSASVFRKFGAFSYGSTDLKLTGASNADLSFSRFYSSTNSAGSALGRGWNFMPVALIDTSEGYAMSCAGVLVPQTIIVQTLNGEKYKYNFKGCSNGGYVAENPSNHMSLSVLPGKDGYSLTLSDNSKYFFNYNLSLRSYSNSSNATVNYSYNPDLSLDKISDGKDRFLQFGYNADKSLANVTDSAGRVIKFGYDSTGNLVSFTDARGNTARYLYSANNQLTNIVDREGNTLVSNVYNSDNLVDNQTFISGAKFSFVYDKVNRTLSKTDQDGHTQTLSYDSKFRTTQISDTLGTVKYSYDDTTNNPYPVQITDRMGYVTKYAYDANFNVTTVTKADGTTQTLSYDQSQRLIATANPASTTDTTSALTYAYDAAGHITQIATGSNSTNLTYNQSGQLTSVNSGAQSTAFGYDSNGLLKSVNDSVNTYQFEYDGVGRVIKKTDPEGRILTFSFDPNDNLISVSNGNSTYNYSYDKENRPVTITLPNGSTIKYAYTGAGQLTSVTDAAGNTSNYSYDKLQNLISTQLGSRLAQYTYDPLNNLTSSSVNGGSPISFKYDANANLVEKTNSLGKTSYQYDSLNRLVKMIHPDNFATDLIYDSNGNLVEADYATFHSLFNYDSSNRLVNTADPFGNKLQYTYDSVGNLSSLTYPDGRVVSYVYGADNRVAKVIDWNGDTTSYVYNKLGQVTQRTMNSVQTNYEYDATGALRVLTHTDTAKNLILAKYTYTRDAMGNIATATSSGSLIDRHISYPDSRGMTSTENGLQTTGTVGTVNVRTGQVVSSKFLYDSLNRLSSASMDVEASSSARSYNYQFDGSSNMTRVDRVEAGLASSTNSSFDTESKLMSASSSATIKSYGYDSDGNLITTADALSSNTLKYDSQGRLIQATGSANLGAANYNTNTNLSYDAFGDRIQKQSVANGIKTATKYVNSRIFGLTQTIAETDIDNNITNLYVYGLNTTSTRGEISSAAISSGSADANRRIYYLEDGLGNVAHLIDRNANWVGSYSYDPYGRVVKQTSSAVTSTANSLQTTASTTTSTASGSAQLVATPSATVATATGSASLTTGSNDAKYLSFLASTNSIMFKGEYFDYDLGYYFMRARFYDQTTGRFITQDPIKHDLAMTQSLNPYQYAYSNPINLHDPNGRGIFDIFGITLFGAAPATSTLNISGLALPKNLNLSTLVNTSSTSTQTMSQTQYNSAQPAAIPTPKPTNSPTPTSTTSTSGSSGSGSSGNGTVYTSLPGASTAPSAPGGTTGTNKSTDPIIVANSNGMYTVCDGSISSGIYVTKGSKIAITGNTGSNTTGYHLHLQVEQYTGTGWTPIDPHPFLTNSSFGLQYPLTTTDENQGFGITPYITYKDSQGNIKCTYGGVPPDRCYQHDGIDFHTIDDYSATHGGVIPTAYAVTDGILVEYGNAQTSMMGKQEILYPTTNNFGVQIRFIYGHLSKWMSEI